MLHSMLIHHWWTISRLLIVSVLYGRTLILTADSNSQRIPLSRVRVCHLIAAAEPTASLSLACSYTKTAVSRRPKVFPPVFYCRYSYVNYCVCSGCTNIALGQDSVFSTSKAGKGTRPLRLVHLYWGRIQCSFSSCAFPQFTTSSCPNYLYSDIQLTLQLTCDVNNFKSGLFYIVSPFLPY